MRLINKFKQADQIGLALGLTALNEFQVQKTLNAFLNS